MDDTRTSHELRPPPAARPGLPFGLEPLDEAPQGSPPAWWRQRRTILEAVVVVILLAAIAVATSSSRAAADKDADERVTAIQQAADQRSGAAEGETTRVKGELAERDKDLEEATERADEADESAKQAAASQLRKDEAKLTQKWDLRNAELDQRSTSLDGRERQIADREAAMTRVEESQVGNGIYQVGVDMAPGRYHTDGSSRGCYFAMLRGSSGSLDDIISNDLFDGPATIDIHSAFFESSGDCTWTKTV